MVTKVVSQLSSGKAPGVDTILERPAGGSLLREELTKLFSLSESKDPFLRNLKMHLSYTFTRGRAINKYVTTIKKSYCSPFQEQPLQNSC